MPLLFFPRPVHQVQIDTTSREQTEDDAPFVFENTELDPQVAYIVRLLDCLNRPGFVEAQHSERIEP